MEARLWIAAAIGALSLSAICAEAQTLRPEAYATRASEPIVIDGRLDEPIWSQTRPIEQFYTRQPVEMGTPSQRTLVHVAYDDDNLYFGFRCYDDGEVVARRMLRDELLIQDDRVSITLDPLLDERNGYFFQVNALGTRLDGIVENSSVSFDWDGIWNAKAQIDSEGYVVELVIPFKTLNVNPDQTTWGLQIFRGQNGSDEWTMWASPYYNSQFFNMAHAGYLHGLEGIQQGLGLDIVANAATRRFDNATTDRRYLDSDPGLDLFYRITPSLSGSFTTNTDFSGAEVDQRQVNLTRFGLFFPETRTFFLKDFKIFDFAQLSQNARPFFSRKIGLNQAGEEVNIRTGTKLTGRIGPANIGLLNVRLEDHDGIDGSDLGVARVSLDVLKDSRIGFIATAGDPDSEDSSTLGGIDLNLKSFDLVPDREISMSMWGQRSRNEGVDSNEGAFGLRLTYPNDTTWWQFDAEEIERNFDPALGFVNRTDIRRFDLTWRRRVRPDPTSSWFERLSYTQHFILGTWVTDTHNQLRSARFELRPFWLETPGGGQLEFSYQRVREVLINDFAIVDDIVIPAAGLPPILLPRSYSWHRGKARVKSSKNRKLSGDFFVEWGGFFGGKRLDLVGEVEWRPSKHYLVAINYQQNELELPKHARLGLRTGGDFTIRIARLRFNWQFTPDLSWNTFAQFDNVTDRIGINSRLRWIVEPGREVLVVLNQGMLVDIDDNLDRDITEPRAKVSWTFRY